jgi:serine/threonine protein kinase
MEDRLSEFRHVRRQLPNKKRLCLTTRGLLKSVYINGYIGSGVFGDVYAGVIKTDENTQDIKHIQKYKKNYDVNFVLKVMYASKPHKQEARIAVEVSDIARQKLCPHFPLYYRTFLCKNTYFRGKYNAGVFREAGDWWKRVKNGNGIIQCSEYTGMSLYDWADGDRTEWDWLIMLAQVCFAIYKLNKEGILHHDLYFSNITMMKVKNPVVMKYTILQREFWIPVRNYYPVIIDFGQSQYKKNDYSGISVDYYQFLTEFSQHKGYRPYYYKKSIFITWKISSRITKLLQKIMQRMFKDRPYKYEWGSENKWINEKYIEKIPLEFYTFFKYKLPGHVEEYNL